MRRHDLNKMTCFLLTITIYFNLQNDRSEKCPIINARVGEGGGGVAVARERRGACRGDIFIRTQIKAPSDIQTHLGGEVMTASNFYS